MQVSASALDAVPKRAGAHRTTTGGGVVLTEPAFQPVLGILMGQPNALRQKRYKVDRRGFGIGINIHGFQRGFGLNCESLTQVRTQRDVLEALGVPSVCRSRLLRTAGLLQGRPHSAAAKTWQKRSLCLRCLATFG
jgi:hypothetical protein